MFYLNLSTSWCKRLSDKVFTRANLQKNVILRPFSYFELAARGNGQKNLVRVNCGVQLPTSKFFCSSFPQADPLYRSSSSRAYPSYSVYNPVCDIKASLILPVFQSTTGNGISTKSNGKFLLEFIYKNNESGVTSSGKVALSPEEIGTILFHVPRGQGVTFVRRSLSVDSPAKVLTVERVDEISNGGNIRFCFTLDFVLNGTGGQPNDENLPVPLSVYASTGEFEVLQALLRDSLPKLTGWSLTNLSLHKAINEVCNDSSHPSRSGTYIKTGSRSNITTGGPGITDGDIFN